MKFVTALIHQEGENFGISFPDFPGCISTGGSFDDVAVRGEQALRLHIEGMVEDGEPMPFLRSPGDIMTDPAMAEDVAGAAAYAMPIPVPEKAVRINITLDEALLRQIDQGAAARGLSRSGFLAAAAKASLTNRRVA
jgi:predicted RNase H-like HicB family nuclease